MVSHDISLGHNVFDLCFAGRWCLSFLASNPIRHVIVFMCGERMTRCEGVCTCVRVSAMDKQCWLNIVLYCTSKEF